MKTTNTNPITTDTMLGDFTVAQVARNITFAAGCIPVRIIPGNDSPGLVGVEAHHENKSGDWIRHPHAYGWRTIYVHSTQVVEVGEKWVRRAMRKGGFRRDPAGLMIEVGARVKEGPFQASPAWALPSLANRNGWTPDGRRFVAGWAVRTENGLVALSNRRTVSNAFAEVAYK